MDPEKKIVTFPVWDLDTNEIIDMEMDADDYEAMCKAEEEASKRQREALDRIYEEERDAWRYARDDD